MAKAFSVLSWNVEHFGAPDKRSRQPKKPVAPIIDLIAQQNADVVGIYQVVGAVVFDEITKKMPLQALPAHRRDSSVTSSGSSRATR